MKEKDLAIMEQFRKCIPIFSVLNDAKRLEIIIILTDFPGEGLTVNGITERIDLSRPAVSHHLKVLKQAGVIGVRSCGVENHYYLTFKAALRNLKILVAQVEASCDLR